MKTDRTYAKTNAEIDVELGDIWKTFIKQRERIARLERETEELREMVDALKLALKDARDSLQLQIYRKL